MGGAGRGGVWDKRGEEKEKNCSCVSTKEGI